MALWQFNNNSDIEEQYYILKGKTIEQGNTDTVGGIWLEYQKKHQVNSRTYIVPTPLFSYTIITFQLNVIGEYYRYLYYWSCPKPFTQVEDILW